MGEPGGLGFGLDLKGFQASVEFVDMQTHSLKPSGATDMHFLYMDGMIRGFGDAEGRCLAARVIEVRGCSQTMSAKSERVFAPYPSCSVIVCLWLPPPSFVRLVSSCPLLHKQLF